MGGIHAHVVPSIGRLNQASSKSSLKPADDHQEAVVFALEITPELAIGNSIVDVLRSRERNQPPDLPHVTLPQPNGLPRFILIYVGQIFLVLRSIRTHIGKEETQQKKERIDTLEMRPSSRAAV